MKQNAVLLVACCLILLAGCPNQPAAAPPSSDSMEPAPPPTNRIDVPLAVRQNLGISFVKAERRAVSSILRYPGRFELRPDAMRQFSARVSGEVTMQVAINQRVEVGQLLAIQESPEAAALVESLAQADAGLASLEASRKRQQAAHRQVAGELAAAEAALSPLEREASALAEQRSALEAEQTHWQARVAELEALIEQRVAVADQLADARAQQLATNTAIAAQTLEEAALASRRNEREQAVLRARTALEAASESLAAFEPELEAARDHRNAMLEHARSVLGQPESEKALNSRIEFRADRAGVVTQAAASGSWLDVGSVVATVVQPERLQMRVSVPVTDLTALRGIASGNILPIGSSDGGESISAQADLTLLDASPAEFGMVELLLLPQAPVTWAVAGMAGRAEMVRAGGARRIAIPVRASIQDGLEILAFVRDPANPDKVIRQPVTLGVSDGEWIVVETGVGPDDEVVLDGIYELKLTGAGKAQMGGHFHADGTFHAGPD